VVRRSRPEPALRRAALLPAVKARPVDSLAGPAGSGGVRQDLRVAASYCATMLAGMRPRSLATMPWPLAHARMSALRSRLDAVRPARRRAPPPGKANRPPPVRVRPVRDLLRDHMAKDRRFEPSGVHQYARLTPEETARSGPASNSLLLQGCPGRGPGRGPGTRCTPCAGCIPGKVCCYRCR